MYFRPPRHNLTGVDQPLLREGTAMTAVSLNYSPAIQTLLPRSVHEVNVLIADDHPARSYSIWTALSTQSDVPAISRGESIEEVLRVAAWLGPQLCIVSVTFGSGEGLGLAHRLKHRPPFPAVLVYADAVDARLAGAAIVAGVDGAFAWETEPERLSELIGRVAAGEKHFPPLLPDPFHELASHVPDPDRRIVAMLLAGAHLDQIARLCAISAREFASRRQAIIRRLDAMYASALVAPEVQ
jgi:DNA-binding NarL/FixJ family response regulator